MIYYIVKIINPNEPIKYRDFARLKDAKWFTLQSCSHHYDYNDEMDEYYCECGELPGCTNCECNCNVEYQITKIIESNVKMKGNKKCAS